MMEPEKIDAIFRQKMEKFQKTPSADAWAKLQSRMEPPKEEKKPVMWLYYAAASIMLVLVSGILWITNQNENTSGTQLANTTKTKIQKAVEPTKTLNETEKEAQFAQNLQGNSVENLGTEAGSVNQTDKVLNQPAKQTQQLATIKTKPVTDPKNTAEKVVSEKAKTPENVVPQPQNQPMLAVAEPKGTPKTASVETVKNESLEILIIKDTPETEMLAVNETPEKPAEKELTKVQLAKNIGKQLLNLKRGDKIDRTELGLPENYSVAFETKILNQKINKTINL